MIQNNAVGIHEILQQQRAFCLQFQMRNRQDKKAIVLYKEDESSIIPLASYTHICNIQLICFTNIQHMIQYIFRCFITKRCTICN
jgi:hypothetical protein